MCCNCSLNNEIKQLHEQCLHMEPAKWRVTVSGELRFMTSYLESQGFFIVTPLNYPNYIENQLVELAVNGNSPYC